MKLCSCFLWLLLVTYPYTHAMDPRVGPGNSCTGGDVRLVGGGNEFTGRVEVCLKGQWGTVCGDTASWGTTDALIVCKQLFGSGNTSFRALDGFYGEGDGSVFSVTCTGRENRLDQCTIVEEPRCRHSQDGGAICADPQCREGDVRLFNIQSSEDFVMGQVEICSSPRMGGVRTKVCDTNWDDQDAEVVCRELGLSHANARAAGRSTFGAGRVPIAYYDNVACEGTESRLIDCQTLQLATSHTDCGYAGVFCQNFLESTQSSVFPLSTNTLTEPSLTASSTETAARQAPASTQSSTNTLTEPSPTASSTVTDTGDPNSSSSPSSSSSTLTDLVTNLTENPTNPSTLIAGILGAVGALIVLLIIATAAILVIIALRKRSERPRKHQQELHSSASKGAERTLENPTYFGASSDSKSNGPGGANEPEHLLMNPLYTIPTPGNNTLSPYTTETDVAHTYEGIDQTKTSARKFAHKNSAGPHGPHPSMPSHLELGNPDEEREYATLQSPGHDYATLEQPSHTHQEPRPYEFPLLNGNASKIQSVALNGNHQYSKTEPPRQTPNYPPQGYEDIVAMASGGREYAEPDLDTRHPYATLEPPASK